ncbi:MAG: GNAT family N-acetyltransferase [Pseudomonadales bacterium]
MALEVHVVPVTWDSHREPLQKLREIVFIDEQKVPREIEWDGADEDCAHFLAVTEAGQPVGCARLMPSGQIGRMAVLADYRGTGLGRRLLDEAIEEAKRRGFTRVHLHAQIQASGFYRKAGFLPVGGEFMEAGIAHQAMELELPIPFEPPGDLDRPALRPQASPRDAAPASELIQYHGETDCLEGLLRGLQQPRRHLVILSQQLDHTLFDNPPVVAAISEFARSSPASDVRILVNDSSLIVSRGHRLVELARRLDSHIRIRRISNDTPPGEQSFVAWDGLGYLLLPDFRDYHAVVDLYDPVQAKKMQDGFDYYWTRSVQDPELRTLRL